MIPPPCWTAEEFERDRNQAIEVFRRIRLEEPLEAYLEWRISIDIKAFLKN
jgi:hypothetical protein